MANRRQKQKASLLQQAITRTANEYFQKTSLNGFGLLYYIRRRKYQRLFWFMFIALGICCATYVVLYTLYGALGDPTITSPHAPQALIWDLPFPAVAVCPVHKLSRHAVLQYAEDLARQQNNGEHTVSDWQQRLSLLVALFGGSAVVNASRAAQAKREMPLESTTATLLQILAPNCEDLLLECYWEGKQHNCSDLLAPLATPIGQCCIFNFRLERELRPAGNTPAQGLTLRLNGSASDHLTATQSGGGTGGFTFQVFDPTNFPDPDVGYMQQFNVAAGEHVQVQLFVSTQRADADAHAVSKQRRRCYFADEEPNEDEDDELLPTLAYSHANCLLRCKVQTMLAQCGCVPHYVATFNISNVPQCSLLQLDCLQQHRMAWHKRLTAMDAQHAWCAHCLPLCSYQRYVYRSQRVQQPRSTATAASDELTVQLYFPTPQALNTYRKDVIYTWYQVLSNIGGVLGICMGCSFISGFEVIYFLLCRLPAHYNELKEAQH